MQLMSLDKMVIQLVTKPEPTSDLTVRTIREETGIFAFTMLPRVFPQTPLALVGAITAWKVAFEWIIESERSGTLSVDRRGKGPTCA